VRRRGLEHSFEILDDVLVAGHRVAAAHAALEVFTTMVNKSGGLAFDLAA
jgi:hypothetical protein